MPDDPTESAEATPVTIFGRTYHLRGNEDVAYLTELAALVDEKMSEVAEATGTADTLKVAILASLNIADECLQSRSGGPVRRNDGNEKRLARMIDQLGEALAG